MTEGRQRKKPRNRNEIHRFWNFEQDRETNTAELLLYGEISDYSWYGDEITPAVFNEELKNIGAVDEITVRINSGGGDVFAAVAIYTRLKEHKANIAVKIDGWCASAATIIAMAGDSIEISVGGVFMIHDPLAGLLGYYNTTDLSNIVKELETIKQSIVNCYMTVSDKSEEEIKSLMTDEGSWFTGQEAVDAGFCTAVMFTEVKTEVENAEKVVVNSVSIGLERFHTVPKGLLGYANSHNNKTNAENKEENNMTLEEFKKNHPDVANAYKSEILAGAGTDEAGSKAAVDAERARIKAIDDITLPGFEDLAEKAKYGEPVSAETFAMQIVAEQKRKGTAFLSDREDDVDNSGVKDVTPISNKGGKGEDNDPYGDIIDKLYPQAE
jgi:ATP-dependent protease ClpP protease subunit